MEIIHYDRGSNRCFHEVTDYKIQKYRNSADYSSRARGEPQILPLIGPGISYDKIFNGMIYILSLKPARI